MTRSLKPRYINRGGGNCLARGCGSKVLWSEPYHKRFKGGGEVKEKFEFLLGGCLGLVLTPLLAYFILTYLILNDVQFITVMVALIVFPSIVCGFISRSKTVSGVVGIINGLLGLPFGATSAYGGSIFAMTYLFYANMRQISILLGISFLACGLAVGTAHLRRREHKENVN